MVADEFDPRELVRGHRLAGVLAHDPVAVVAADGVGDGREFLVDAAGAADEGDQRGEFADRGGVAVPACRAGREFVEAGVGLPDVERGEVGALVLR